MNVRLFSMPGSHAATTGQLLFDYKGINYKRTDLLPVVSCVALKALRLPGNTVRLAIAAFPGMLQRIDDWIEEGVLGGEPSNAADLQIAPSVRLAMSLDDLRPAIEDRPAAWLATKIVPHFPGRTPSVLPLEWLKPITAPAG